MLASTIASGTATTGARTRGPADPTRAASHARSRQGPGRPTGARGLNATWPAPHKHGPPGSAPPGGVTCIPDRSPPPAPSRSHISKSPENRRDGYRAHIAACPETGIITSEELTRAAGRKTVMPPPRRGSWTRRACRLRSTATPPMAQRGPARGAGRGRAYGGDQAQAGQARGRGRVHRR